jgi:hypothetical protein
VFAPGSRVAIPHTVSSGALACAGAPAAPGSGLGPFTGSSAPRPANKAEADEFRAGVRSVSGTAHGSHRHRAGGRSGRSRIPGRQRAVLFEGAKALTTSLNDAAPIRNARAAAAALIDAST